MYFITKRLIVNKLSLDDLEVFVTYRNKDEVKKYQSWNFYPENIAKYRLTFCANNNFNEFMEDYSMALRLYDGTLIGDLYLSPKQQNTILVGYTIDSIYWKQGYGFEMLEGLFDYLKTLQYTTVRCNVYTNNIASINLLEKCNFIKFRQSLFKNDCWYEKKL